MVGFAFGVFCIAAGGGLFAKNRRVGGTMGVICGILFVVFQSMDWTVAYGGLLFLLVFMGILGTLELMSRRGAYMVATAVLVLMLVATSLAPTNVSSPDMDNPALLPSLAGGPILGTDIAGIPLLEYALQGAAIVTIPALASGALVGFFAILAGVSRCASIGWTDQALQAFSELVGALPRLVVILVVALGVPPDWRSLMPIGLTWAVLSAPGAMDEAAATAGRLGGSKFVEALRAHGFTASRIYLYHIIGLNLRPVIVRQAAEVGMQVIFLEIALSYLAQSQQQPSFTHADSSFSWAKLLYDGYTAIVAQRPLYHELVLGLTLVALTAIMAQAFRLGARAR